MSVENLSIRRQIAEQDYQTQRSFTLVAWGVGSLLSVLLWQADSAGTLRWFLLYAALCSIPTALVFLRRGTKVLPWLIPLTMTLNIVTITFMVDSGYSSWAVYFSALVCSITTRNAMATLPATGIVLAAAAFNERPMNAAVLFNLGLVALAGMTLFLVARRMRKLAAILEGAALQDDTVRQLDVTMARLTEAGARVAESADQLHQGAAAAARQVGEILLPAVDRAGEARGRLRTTQEETAGRMERLGQAVAQVAGAMEKQDREVTEASNVARSMAQTTASVAGRSAEVAAAAARGAEQVKEGQGLSAHTQSAMQELQVSLQQAAGQMQSLAERSSRIDAAVTTVASIAGQTNMLALNAAIEAARAGQSGQGFAVVAEEVRKLAELSAQSAQQIGVLIQGIQAGTAEAVRSMAVGSSEVKTGSGLAEEAGRALADILQVAERIAGGVEEIALAVEQVEAASQTVANTFDTISAATEENTAATEQMAASAAQVAEALAGIAGIARENAAVAEEVSASTEELTAAAGSVAESAAGLKEIAAGLEAETSRFRA